MGKKGRRQRLEAKSLLSSTGKSVASSGDGGDHNLTKKVNSKEAPIVSEAHTEGQTKSKKRKRPEGEVTGISKLQAPAEGAVETVEANGKDSKNKLGGSPEAVIKNKKHKDSHANDLNGGEDISTTEEKLTSKKKKKKNKSPSIAVVEEEGTSGENVSQEEGERPKLVKPKSEKTAVRSISNGNQKVTAVSKLQEAMQKKLAGGRFRMINEDLYTKESEKSFEQFTADPSLFTVYHHGYREQVEKWPVNPLDVIISWLSKYPKAVVADFGCGEARLSESVSNKVHSFDLCSPNPRVIACDMAHVPLADRSAHIAVFCLSLMGTNLADFVREAYRVLVPKGVIKIAEVRSRFEGTEGGLQEFLDLMTTMGFDNRQCDASNDLFVLMEFKKTDRKPDPNATYTAKPCVYKRR